MLCNIISLSLDHHLQPHKRPIQVQSVFHYDLLRCLSKQQLPPSSPPLSKETETRMNPLCLVSPLESKLPFKDDLTLTPAETTAEDDDFPPHIIELFRRDLPAPTRSISHYYPVPMPVGLPALFRVAPKPKQSVTFPRIPNIRSQLLTQLDFLRSSLRRWTKARRSPTTQNRSGSTLSTAARPLQRARWSTREPMVRQQSLSTKPR